ncbi:F-box/kelch-repeat protein [Camellia lanceoleosa]|uniref:F-box/kelch-repeat protein n=1 Tax=Camellia lanceoleosa TaxID=1840588 RepID=A0ACC0J2W7_9ERIC|nr:F-box/kelch-repeat protein [Camellia lanceoleosa]
MEDHDSISISQAKTMFSRLDGPYGYTVNLNYPLKTLRLDAGIGGSCDGLVCVYLVENYNDIIHIWNPTTRKHKSLPSFGKGFILSISYGFGYDSSNDDYKVVRISNFNDSLEVKIYSLRTNS